MAPAAVISAGSAFLFFAADGATTTPADAAEHMRAATRADADGWGRVLTALDAWAGGIPAGG
jgi:hypothetical protein